MTITWTSPSGVDTCTLSASGVHSTAAIIAAAGAPAGANVLMDNGTVVIHELRDCRIVIENGSAWQDLFIETDANHCDWTFHTFNGTSSAVEFQGATSRFERGDLIIDSAPAPVTARGCGYWFLTTNILQNWSRYNVATGGNGIFRMYGGMFTQISALAFDAGGSVAPTVPFTITGDTSGATAVVTRVDLNSGVWTSDTAAGFFVLKSQSKILFQNNENMTFGGGSTGSADADGVNICPQLFLPDDEVRIYQAQWPRYGGFKFFGTDNQILESRFKRSPGKGWEFDGANASVLRKIEFTRNLVALDLDGSGDATIFGASFRGNVSDIVTAGASSWDGTLILVDSDDLATGTLNFDSGENPNTNFILEQTSFQGFCFTTAGAGITGVRCRTMHDGSQRSNGAETTTPAGGAISQYLNTRARYDENNTTVGTPLAFGAFHVRLYDYGRKFVDLQVTPDTGAISTVFEMADNPFSIDGTGGQLDDDTAAALTGVARTIAETDTLGSAVTIAFNENSPSPDTIVRSSGSWLTDGFEDDMDISVWDSDSNDGTYHVDTAVALTLTLSAADDLAAESAHSRPVLWGMIIDITSGTANTLNKIYSKLQSVSAAANGTDAPEVMKTADGVNYAMPRASIIKGLQAQNVDFEGGTIINQDGSTRLVGVAISGIVSGAECSVVNAAGLVIGTVTSTGTSATVVVTYPGSDIPVSVRVRLAGRDPYRLETTLISSGLVISADFPVDPEFTP